MTENIKLQQARRTAGVILSLAWPTVVEEVLATAVQYIDTAMVGTLGTQATATVGATTSVGWLVFSSISALSIGFLALIARAYGAGEEEQARKAVSQAVFITLVVGILSTLLLLGVSGYVPGWMQVDAPIRPLASAYFFIR